MSSATEQAKWAEVKRRLGIEHRCPSDDALDITLGELCDAVLAALEQGEAGAKPPSPETGVPERAAPPSALPLGHKYVEGSATIGCLYGNAPTTEFKGFCGRSRADHLATPAASPTTETEETIEQWAFATFGHAISNASVAARALKELAELIQKLTANDNHPGAADELADVEIVLARLWVYLGAERQFEIDRKMAINRARKWRLTGDGHGQHI